VRAWVPVPGSLKARSLAAAIARFEAEGFERVAVTALARDAGTTTGALDHHFGSKQGLFAAVRFGAARTLSEPAAPAERDALLPTLRVLAADASAPSP
jgi:AcrR family transcriptional regulator